MKKLRFSKRPRFLLLHRRWLALPAAVACVVGLCVLVTALPAAVSAYATDRQIPIYCVERQDKVCALSFDAAWGNEDTQELIDVLARYDVKVTFFVVGEWVDKYPESVRALAEAGHEVMCHSNDHAHFNSLSADQIVADITACCDKIEAVTGARPTLFRPPFGEYDDHVVATVRGMGLEVIQWDVDSLDWKDYDAPTICQRVCGKVQPGSIVLFHNAALHTPEALPTLLETLIHDGYTMVPVSQLILPGVCGTDYTVDHTGRQCPME